MDQRVGVGKAVGVCVGVRVDVGVDNGAIVRGLGGVGVAGGGTRVAVGDGAVVDISVGACVGVGFGEIEEQAVTRITTTAPIHKPTRRKECFIP